MLFCWRIPLYVEEGGILISRRSSSSGVGGHTSMEEELGTDRCRSCIILYYYHCGCGIFRACESKIFAPRAMACLLEFGCGYGLGS